MMQNLTAQHTARTRHHNKRTHTCSWPVVARAFLASSHWASVDVHSCMWMNRCSRGTNTHCSESVLGRCDVGCRWFAQGESKVST